MKKTAVIILTIIALLSITGLSTSAEENREAAPAATEERALEGYILSADGETLTLTEYIEGVPTPIAVGEASTLLSLVSDGSRVLFDSITLTETLELPAGSYTYSGALTLLANASLTVGCGTSIALSSLSLTLEGGALRVRGGAITAVDSHITSSATAAVLDYSSSSTLTLTSGSIVGEGTKGAIDVRSGSLVLLGGRVESRDDVAVYNDSATYLSGAPTVTGVGADIYTEKPIYLSCGGVPYSSLEPMTVRYGETFSRGSCYEIFYTADPTSYSNVTLLDALCREYSLTHLAGVGAVRLPYTVRYYTSDGLIATDECLSGERSTPPTLEDRLGYSFSGWYLDREGRVGYSTDSAITSDLTVYALYTLTPPEFSVSSIDTVYDGRDRTLAFDTLSHELDGIYIYSWYRDGVLISTSPSITVRDVRDSGSYSCEATFSYGGSSVTVRAEGISVRIAKRSITLPEIPSVYYNGRAQYPDIVSSSIYTVEEISGIDAGSYSVALTLVDPDNCRWETTDDASASATFEILEASNAWIEELSVFDVYFGAEIAFSALPKFGTATVFYSLTEDGPYSATTPVAVGDYYAIARVSGNGNYSSIESRPQRFSILEEYVLSLELTHLPEDTEYRAFEHFNPYGLIVTAKYAGGRSERITPERISVSYQRDEAFRLGDSGVILSFGGVSVTLPLTVTHAEYDLSGLVIGATSVTYDARFHSLEYTLESVVGLDGIPLTVSASGGGVDVGEYAVRLVFDSESLDYRIPDSIDKKITILPISREIMWQNTDFVYNGTLRIPTAYYLDVHGVTRYLPVTGGEVDAGDGYVAVATPDTQNYSFTGLHHSFTVRRADYDMEGVYWSADSFTYDSSEHRVTLHGLPDGVRVVGYTDGYATAAGEYVATASLVWDTRNYNPPTTPTHTWRIERADYDLANLRFDSAIYIYDGECHYPRVTGTAPTGLDGIALTYTFSAGATHVSDGRVTVRISFATDSRNYNTPDTLTAYVEIDPMPITVVWTGASFNYDGTPKLPTATAAECSVAVTGEGSDAGEYTAVATSVSSDYVVTNSTYAFVILPIENRFTSTLSIDSIYFGRTPAPTAESYFGEPVYRYYIDSECRLETAVPTAPGRYFVRASVPASRNYLELVGEPVAFEIMEILPISIAATLASEPRAFTTLTLSDLECLIHNNDGSVTAPDPSLLRIFYESGDSLRRSDTHVTLEYLGVTLILELEVAYAVYDTSSVSWQGTVATYDGMPKCPTLAGLPTGVGVLEYIIDGGINAGEYTVTARLSYDAENYLEPAVPECTMVINKLTVEPPIMDNVVYDGNRHLPTSPSPHFIFSDVEYVDAGKYTVTATLRDPRNHTLSGGGDSCYTVFEITPREISVTVSDGKKYLWEDVRYGGFVADLSSVIAGDDPMIREQVSGDTILAVCDNPNYRAAVTSGRLHTYSYPSPELCADIFVVFFIIVTLILVSLIVWLERARVADFLAVTRCRISSYRASHATHVTRAAAVNTEPESVEPITPAPQDNSEATDECDTPGDTDIAIIDSSEAFDGDDDPTPDAISELESTVTAIDTERADELISDSLAKGLVKRGREIVRTSGSERSIINVDTLSRSFSSGDRVDVNILKQKSLVPYDTAYIKVLARGVLDKSLSVYANDFSLAAVKMIALTGGEAVRVVTVKEKKDTNN